MNEPWLMEQLQNAASGKDLVKIDSESAAISFCIGTSSEAVPPKWGNITGDISDQTDLKTAIDGKIDKVSGSPEMKFGCDDQGVYIDVEESA